MFSLIGSSNHFFLSIYSPTRPYLSLPPIFDSLNKQICFLSYFHQIGPTGPSWSKSRHVRVYVCVSVCVSVCAIGCSFFLGLSLALRSHDQILAYHCLPPARPPRIFFYNASSQKKGPIYFVYFFDTMLLSAHVVRVGVSCMQDFF